MTQLAADDFERADGALGANWTAQGNYDSAPVILSGRAAPGGASQGDNSAARYTGISWPDDQYSEITPAVVPTTGNGGVAAHIRIGAAANRDCYGIAGDQSATQLYKFVLSSYTQLGTSGPGIAAGDTLRVWAVGTSIYASKNGSLICGSPITDGDQTAGDAGIQIEGTTARIESWTGGTPSTATSLAAVERHRTVGRGILRGV